MIYLTTKWYRVSRCECITLAPPPWRYFNLGIAISEFFSNPGISGLKNANPMIPGLNPGIESLRYYYYYYYSWVVGGLFYKAVLF